MTRFFNTVLALTNLSLGWIVLSAISYLFETKGYEMGALSIFAISFIVTLIALRISFVYFLERNVGSARKKIIIALLSHLVLQCII